MTEIMSIAATLEKHYPSPTSNIGHVRKVRQYVSERNVAFLLIALRNE